MKAYKVTFINYGEPTVAYHYNRTEKAIRKGYALEGLKVVSVEEIRPESKEVLL